MRRTLANARASRIPEALNLRGTDPRFVQYVNEATERLLSMGHWHGTVQRFRMVPVAGVLTFPPQIATIEAVAINGEVGSVRDYWYEFMGDGLGIQNPGCSSGLPQAIARGNYPTFGEISPPGKKVRMVCERAEDAGKPILVMGRDDQGNWIRTQVAGAWQDGEYIPLAEDFGPSSGANSVNNFAAISDVVLPAGRVGQCWMYEYTDSTYQVMIGQYQYWETNPSYTRYFFPSIGNNATNVTVEVMAKLAFIPVAVDSDYLILGNLAALKLGCLAVKAEEDGRYSDASLLWYGGTRKDGVKLIGAVNILNEELDHYLGSGREMSMNIRGEAFDTPIETLV